MMDTYLHVFAENDVEDQDIHVFEWFFECEDDFDDPSCLCDAACVLLDAGRRVFGVWHKGHV